VILLQCSSPSPAQIWILPAKLIHEQRGEGEDDEGEHHEVGEQLPQAGYKGSPRDLR
jgi:hypothetical protein